MLRFNAKYFLVSCVLFLVLVYIAMYVKDQFIRPFGGDVLVVIWLCVFFKSIVSVAPYKLAHYVLAFAWSIEIAQYFKLVNILGLQDNKIASVAIGSTFDWQDLLAYTIGWGFILVVERYKLTHRDD